ncbi:uncharacterized protein V1518DRAFT_369916 [Limtongia smithiae]|uniref:uncharacterized protein n=1 Tax=Limtongia smithiae TaxID=1125753 RepID=UPI0034CD5CB1
MSRSNPLDVDLLRRDDDTILDHLRTSSTTSSKPIIPNGNGTVLTESPTRDLNSDFARFRERPIVFLQNAAKHLLGTTYRSYENYVGREIFYSGFTQEMKEHVMKNELLQEKIMTLARRSIADSPVWSTMPKESQEKRLREVEKQLQEVTAEITQNMICKFEHKSILRTAYYVVMQMLGRTYNQGFHINASEITRLKEVATMTAAKRQSLIFLPCHRSHIDYICIQAICFRVGISLPTVVAGDNLNFAVIGPALNRIGAMWIRRSFGDDQLYGTVIQSYIDTLLSGGYNFECFIEGGRSRLGKLLPPKFGILKYIFDSVLSGRVEDCWIVPVSTQYDRVIETESYVSELLGSEKKKESLRDFVDARNILSLKMGRVDVRFHEPWSLSEYIGKQLERTAGDGAVPTFAEAMQNSVLKTRVLRSLGYEVLSDINAVSVVMPTALIGTVLLTLRGRGIGHIELIRKIEWLCVRIQERGGRVADFGSLTTAQVADRGLEVLGDLVGHSGDKGELLEKTFFAADRFQLSFYRNMVIHLFVSDAIVSVAMYTKIKQGSAASVQQVPIKYLFEQVQWLSKLLAGEFVYNQQGGIRSNFWESIQLLRDQGVIEITENGCVELSMQERLRGREFFDFYCFLLWPFCDGYWLASISLFALTPMATSEVATEAGSQSDLIDADKETLWVDVKSFLDMAQLLGKTIYAQGDLSYFEAVNKEVLRSAFNQLEAEGIIVVRRSKSGRTPAIMSLAPAWLPQRYDSDESLAESHLAEFSIKPEGRLWDYTEKISEFRREGKNRRDSESMSQRVLTLADSAGRMLERKMQSFADVTKPETDALVRLSRATRVTASKL